jgi:hypothetical protein
MARQIVKDNLKRRNCKVTDYASREISKMAEQYLNEGHWAEPEAQALEKIMGCPKLRAEYEAYGRKLEAQMAKRLAKHV